MRNWITASLVSRGFHHAGFLFMFCNQDITVQISRPQAPDY